MSYLVWIASIEKWTEEQKESLDNIVKGSVSDVYELATRRQASVKETGGTYREGFIPVDTSELIQSQLLMINGGHVGAGELAYEAVIANMNAGDVAELVFTAEHARPVEYGTERMGGRFYVRNAVQNWQRIVDANAALYGDG